jgi:hypothetical protein
MRRFVFLVVFGILVAAAPLGATVAFSNMVGNCCGGYLVGGTTGPETLAAAFTPAANFLMTDAQVEIFSDIGIGDPFFNISLYGDGGSSPAGLIGMFGVDLDAPPFGGIVTASGTAEQLKAGVQYWLVLSPFDNNSWVGWEMGGSSYSPFNSLASPGTWFPVAVPANVQFQIDSTPEPACWTLAAFALMSIVIARIVVVRSNQW